MSTSKQKTYPVILTEKFLTVITNKSLTVTSGDSRYSKAVELYKAKRFDELINLLDRPAAIERYSKGAVKVYDGAITHNGKTLDGFVVNRVLEFVKLGLPFEPLVAFIDRLYKNTSQEVRNKLYSFLENNHLGITDNGLIIAFKLVTNSGKPPYHSGTFFETQPNGKSERVSVYRVGYEYTYPRNEIREGSDDCSSPGLYVGNRNYWQSQFDSDGNFTDKDNRLLIAEIDPADVCNVARYESSKMVVCRMRIVGEYRSLKKEVTKSVIKRSKYGFKPDGSAFYNVRSANGKFTKRTQG